MFDQETEPESPSRSAIIIKSLKEARHRRGKFGLSTLFIVIFLLATLMACVRATIGFENFFVV